MRGKPSSATGSAIAAVIGLVTITPAAGFVTPASAIIIGIIGCAVSYSILEFHLMPAKVDDTLDVFACHGVAGLTGCILTGIFATTLVNADGTDGTLWQSRGAGRSIIAVLVSVAITVIGTTIILLLIKAIMPIRHTAEEEEIGIDIVV